MSNTSYSIKRNSHVIDNQGGEKKVMKKILSVALSTAMAFSMFASVAFGADANLTPQQKFDVLKQANIMDGMPDGSSALEKTLTRAELAKIIVKSIGLEPITGVATYKDKNYTVNHWAAPFIEAATQAGILNGKDEAKQLFDPSGNVTVQELAKVLVAALKLEVPAEANNSASEWAKGYVAAAVKEGFLPEGINYQANATRSQAIVAAYAIYEANQVPTVASYKVVDPKNVEFTMSDDEVVKVALETALEANKETEVKFTYQDREYTHKVTYVTTVAQTVQSVKADDLKQVVVTFDGTVDPATAEDPNSYSISGKIFEKATLSEDKTSVTLLLDKNSVLTNQKEVELTVNAVKNEDGTKTFDQKVKFTPVDVTTPSIKEVTALGTKAIKVKFSEPVEVGEASKSTNYKIDGKLIGASVTYAYPDTVILTTNLEEGAHKLSVSNVADFSGLRVVPVDNEFTATVDTAAPEIVSIKTYDLKKVTVEFNEPIKRVDSAYANVSGNTPDIIKVEDNKVILEFNQNKPLNYGENTIFLKGVRDYSENSADRDGKVTPTLDTTRPTVVSSEYKTDTNGDFIVKLRFNKALKSGTATDRKNYVLKDSEGKVADKDGTDSKGNPLLNPTYNNNIVEVNLGKNLGNSSYTLTVSDLEDTAYVANKILPYTVNLDAGTVQKGKINRVWVDNSGTTKYVYIEFNKAVKTSGEGSALEAAKYTYSTTQNGPKTFLTDDNDDVQLITSDTVRIATTHALNQGNDYVQANYIAAADGTYLTQNGYELSEQVTSNVITLNKATVTSKEELKLEFKGKISSVNLSDFVVRGTASGSYVPNGYTLSADQTILYLKFTSDNNLPLDPQNPANPLRVYTQATTYTQDSLGNKLVISNTDPNGLIQDDVAPKVAKDNDFRIVPVTGATYNLTIDLTEKVDLHFGNFTPGQLFEIKVNNTPVSANDITDVDVDATGKQLIVTFNRAVPFAANDVVFVKYNAVYTEAIRDTANKNLGSFEATLLYQYTH